MFFNRRKEQKKVCWYIIMRIVKQDRKQGLIRLVVEDVDDLWDLQSVLEKGDLVTSSSERKINLGGSDEKARIIKRRVTLTINVDKVTFDQTLRVLGTITQGPDDIPKGSAHSFTLQEGVELSIKKEWSNYQLKRIKDATKPRNKLLVVLFDREQALFLAVTSQGVNELRAIKGLVSKKALDETVKNTFYQDIITNAQDLVDKEKPSALIFASPAFWLEYLKKILPDSLKKSVFTTISDVEKTAVRELLQRPELQSVIKDNRAAQELLYVEEALQALAHDKLAYGDKEVREVIEQANAKTVLVSESFVHKKREQDAFSQTEHLLRAAESNGAKVHILSSNEACEKIDGLTGFVVLMRW